MKTPREVLLQRRSAIQPRLDAVRAAVLATLPPAQRSRPLDHRPWWQVAVWEIFGSARTAWAGIGVLGLAALGLEFAAPSSGFHPEPGIRPASRVAIVQVIEERTRILAELGPIEGGPTAESHRTPRVQAPSVVPPRKPEARRSFPDWTTRLV
jgi:hypothetical protein